MQKIEAIIRHTRFEAVRQALLSCGVEGMTITEVGGVGHEQPQQETYRGVDHVEASIPRSKIEVVVDERFVDPAIEAIQHAAWTGKSGDGLIMVTEIGLVVRIRSGETAGSTPFAIAH